MSSNDDAEPAAERMARLLKDKLLPRMVEAGVFGDDMDLTGVEAAPIGGLGQDHWASTTLTTTLQLAERNSNAKKRSLALVSKCMLESDGFEGYALADVQADNEVNMYSKVFPFFEQLADGCGVTSNDLHPKTYFAESRVEELLSLTVMEDLKARGFRLATERTALDRKHVSLALRAIGRMHAFSHAAKARCRDEFLRKVANVLREPVFTPEWPKQWGAHAAVPMRRGLDRLAERLQEADDRGTEAHRRRAEGLRRMRAVAEDVYPLLAAAASPQEPAGVIVHGDFCRNNMQFHYGSDGQPDQVCLFDFQNSRYCSPAVDLSFFLFLNTSPAMRAQHWDDLLLEYFSSLQDTLDKLLEGHDVHEDFVMPTLGGVQEDLGRFALWGFSICSFFLPQMMAPPEEAPPLDEIKESCGAEEDRAALMAVMLKVGGDRATEALADLALEFLDRDLVPVP